MLDNKAVIEKVVDYRFIEIIKKLEEVCVRDNRKNAIDLYPMTYLESVLDWDLLNLMGRNEAVLYNIETDIVKNRFKYLAENMYKNVDVYFRSDDSVEITYYREAK